MFSRVRNGFTKSRVLCCSRSSRTATTFATSWSRRAKHSLCLVRCLYLAPECNHYAYHNLLSQETPLTLQSDTKTRLGSWWNALDPRTAWIVSGGIAVIQMAIRVLLASFEKRHSTVKTSRHNSRMWLMIGCKMKAAESAVAVGWLHLHSDCWIQWIYYIYMTMLTRSVLNALSTSEC